MKPLILRFNSIRARTNLLRTLPILLLLFSFSCIAVRVYVPKQGTDQFDTGNVDNLPQFAVPKINPRFEVTQSAELEGQPFAQRIPSLFFLAPNRLENEYGSVKTLIERELDRNREEYKTDKRIGIQIRDFELKTTDHCIESVSGIRLNVEVIDLKSKEKLLDFRHEDKIESNVTDCYFTLATGTILGWLVYMPYLGFRGNREDQLNFLGRVALLEFFEMLKQSLAQKTLPPKPSRKQPEGVLPL
ncbi:hypothetical protein CH379_012815 [Leptospira ellisii]|uniref:Lipoprotein n=1 Tax=Leptospira ellisii TaxID=2023197 RepID=A0A2N0BP92_9LEPT|nr:hypothetical protein [Leptospira ellisii]MDV6236509.1 hypothetical protein [Leptospira ellisii]PJZ94548.1 hypothetical protein CH379_02010 [Leptospira ellisii]PKA05806.1 hypothetical protein CH375_03090 [Leptospira ellisii]